MVVAASSAYTTYDDLRSYTGTRFELHLAITYGTLGTHITLTYVSLVLAAWKDGGQLVESLRRIETAVPIGRELLKKIRIASIATVATATILVKKIDISQ